jgi:hypothetical protein
MELVLDPLQLLALAHNFIHLFQYFIDHDCSGGRHGGAQLSLSRFWCTGLEDLLLQAKLLCLDLW